MSDSVFDSLGLLSLCHFTAPDPYFLCVSWSLVFSFELPLWHWYFRLHRSCFIVSFTSLLFDSYSLSCTVFPFSISKSPHSATTHYLTPFIILSFPIWTVNTTTVFFEIETCLWQWEENFTLKHATSSISFNTWKRILSFCITTRGKDRWSKSISFKRCPIDIWSWFGLGRMLYGQN